jgi:ATP-dependent Clp protease ATP-binding subunit ClpB
MRDDLTPAVQRALEAAGQWAARLGAAGVGPLHLLAGLLDEEEGKAWALLSAAGLDAAAWRDDLAARAAAAADSPPPPLGSASHEALALARELAALASADRIVSSDCLVLALVRTDLELRCALEARGLDVERCEAASETSGPPLVLDEPLALGDVAEQVDTARALDAAATGPARPCGSSRTTAASASTTLSSRAS